MCCVKVASYRRVCGGGVLATLEIDLFSLYGLMILVGRQPSQWLFFQPIWDYYSSLLHLLGVPPKQLGQDA